jgi:hypothetical protein
MDTDLPPDSPADLVGSFVEQGCAAITRTLEASVLERERRSR